MSNNANRGGERSGGTNNARDKGPGGNTGEKGEQGGAKREQHGVRGGRRERGGPTKISHGHLHREHGGQNTALSKRSEVHLPPLSPFSPFDPLSPFSPFQPFSPFSPFPFSFFNLSFSSLSLSLITDVSSPVTGRRSFPLLFGSRVELLGKGPAPGEHTQPRDRFGAVGFSGKFSPARRGSSYAAR